MRGIYGILRITLLVQQTKMEILFIGEIHVLRVLVLLMYPNPVLMKLNIGLLGMKM